MIEPILYILMRNDLDSLNPGKACAQAAHAANDVQSLLESENTAIYFPKAQNLFYEWKNSANRTFGTTIVLEAPWDEIKETIDHIQNISAGYTNNIHDPTYPIRDGQVTHLIPLNTCAWVFGERNELSPYLEHLELMK